MPWSLIDIYVALPVFALVLFRLSGLMLTAPIYGSRLIPIRFRAGLTVLVAALVFPLVRGQAPVNITFSSVVGGAVGEMMVGAIIGLSLAILLAAGEVAGLIVGRQASISLANVFDPSRNEQTSIVGQVYTFTLTTLFLLAGGHRATMAALLDTFEVIPLLSFRWDESFMVLLVEMLGATFILGIRLAGPVLLALFLMGTALAFLSRTMPQFNVLTVGFTLRILVGLGVASLALMGSQSLLLDAVWEGVDQVRLAFGLDLDRHLVN